ncbi:SDR family NAD(P)-dependent oxidoreductase [Streptomyces xanthii]|uniref:SDR family NAD(P)-dependent oxidoreductase n=1 Tax=Streptomyces xanthii TaxID=2768069 RepID=A0A7H1BKH2_9ACTN|nr:SDR family NAD(P)-dependent oxidoreductase [Streptomyces xanthii]QNS09227.1 SDR family NAD(P)-dependent oxidoreductase [Streptomyces xanthii]
MDGMDAKEILTRVKTGALDAASAAALLRAPAPPEPAAVDRATAEALLRAAAPPAPAAPATPSAAAPAAAPAAPALEPVAVIGYSARFPGAGDADTFWQRILDGDDLVTEVPADRWRTDEHYDADPGAEGKSVSKWGAFLDDVDRFDADFFRMTPREAELTDPQARLFLQEAWRALEHAGQRTGSLAGARVGVHAGVMMNDYQDLVERESEHARLAQVMQGNSNSLLAARIAYHLDLKGPAVTVDTACSSSLVALHQACQSLWLGDADMMLVGGVTLYLTELPHVFMSRAGMLSPRGHCSPFDASADGIVPGEGCAVVVLKPLSKALADGDPVHAVVRASGLNQDGRTNGITAPSAASQARLIGTTLDRFGLTPDGIDYVECHGTGTPLGDPIEVTALNEVFAPAGRPAGSVPIGSVKGNVGHTSAAAGLAGLIKAIGVVRSGQVPPSLHCTAGTLNPGIPFTDGPFTVATERQELPAAADRPRRASVSSFGFSGTNAYVVVEQAPAPAHTPGPDGPVLVPLSGRRPAAVTDRAAELARWLRSPGGADAALGDLAHTLSCARDHHPHRAALLVADRDELLDALDRLASGEPDERRVEAPAEPLADREHRRARAALADRFLDRADDATARPGALRELAELYTEGHTIDFTRLCPPTRHRRIPAPGYAFARDRHYVTAERGVPGERSARGERLATDGRPPVMGERPAPAPRPVPGALSLADLHAVSDGYVDPDLHTVSYGHSVPNPHMVTDSQAVPGPQPVSGPNPVTDGHLAPHPRPVPGALSLADLHAVSDGHVVTDPHAVSGGRTPSVPVTPTAPYDDLSALALHTPGWQDAPLPAGVPELARGPLLVHDTAGRLGAALGGRSLDGIDAVRATDPEAVPLVVRLGAEPGADTAAFAALRTVLGAFRTQRLTVLAVTADPLKADAARALVQTLRQENPRLDGRALLVDDDGAAAADAVRAELTAPQAEAGHLADVRGGRRARRVLRPAPLPERDVTFRPGGVHLVTGGTGGIGRALARRLAARPGTRVVVCGRTPWAELDPAVRPPADGSGGIRYVRADVSTPAGARALIDDILGHEGALHGVFHAAGVVRDAYLLRKTPDDVAAVLAPKAAGALALDEATAGLPLDVFALFSSVAALGGNLGQADYAYANGVLDALAERRAERVAAGERHGRTVSVQWPLWDVPGMTIPGPVREEVEERVGMVPLPAELGLRALERVLGPDGPVVVSLFHGDRDRWHRSLAGLHLLADDGPSQPTPAPAAAPAPAPAGPASSVALLDLVCRTVADALGHDRSAIGPRTSLEALGLDSVMIRTLASRLSAEVAPVGPEMLFGLRDLTELAEHLARLVPVPSADTATPVERAAATTPVPVPAPATLPVPVTDPALDDAVAIVGLAGRYPGADDPEAFWENLLAGKDTVGDLPTDRWEHTGDVRARGHFLDHVDRFDPAYFGMSSREAAYTDPQERLFLEVAREALEDAGLAGSRLDRLTAPDGEPRSVGVFAGITSADYPLLGAERWAAGGRDMPSAHAWSLPNRLSYLLDLRGPSQPVDTACSSSLVALHQAVEALRRGECAAALVGGVNLYLHPSRFRMLRQSGFLAEDGLCRSFGAGGAGFGPGEGAGAVVVKPLARALADGDTVHAVIRGTAVAHGGRTNGYTAPSPWAQARVVREALRRSGVDPATVNVIEAHGTGTELGDPVELAGLQETYGRGGAADVPCSLGSVKSAVGHGESAAGIAALTKVLLQLRHGTLAPTLHAEPVNPALDLAATRFRLQHDAAPWPRLRDAEGRELPRRAGISSFGAGGVNAHVVLEEHLTTAPARPQTRTPQLVVLSAPSPAHLSATAARLARWLTGAGADTPLADLARTLHLGRASHEHRLAVVTDSVAALAAELARYAADGTPGGALRTGTATAAASDQAPETDDLVAALWRAGRLEQVADLWVSGWDVDREALEALDAPEAQEPGPRRIVPLPPSAYLATRHWFADEAPRTPQLAAFAPEFTPEPAPVAVPEPATTDPRLARLVAFVGELAAGPGAEGPIDTARTLVELGVDSIGAMNLRFEITERFGRTLPLQLLSEFTVDELVAHLSDLQSK